MLEKKSPQLPRGLGYTFAFEELQRNKLSLPLICKIVKKYQKYHFLTCQTEIKISLKIEPLQSHETQVISFNYTYLISSEI